MDDISDIQAMYNAAWDNEDDRLHRHQLEHDMTWRYLEKYLPPPGSSLLEVGAATGRYTLQLAQRGYKVLAIDLSPEMVAGARARAIEAGLDDRIEFRVGDARTLTNIPEEAYDGVLLMGPLYHLVLREDRLLALNNIYKSLKKGGIIFSSWISRFGIFGELIKSAPDIVRRKDVMLSVLERGRDPDWYRSHAGSFRGYFAVVGEIAPIHQEIGFQTLSLAGVEPAISADDASYNILEGEQRRLWLDVLFRLSVEPDMIASSRHLLYVGKKAG
jgi:S-adenosylmethionine-dependent methyltransferase